MRERPRPDVPMSDPRSARFRIEVARDEISHLAPVQPVHLGCTEGPAYTIPVLATACRKKLQGMLADGAR